MFFYRHLYGLMAEKEIFVVLQSGRNQVHLPDMNPRKMTILRYYIKDTPVTNGIPDEPVYYLHFEQIPHLFPDESNTHCPGFPLFLDGSYTNHEYGRGFEVVAAIGRKMTEMNVSLKNRDGSDAVFSEAGVVLLFD